MKKIASPETLLAEIDVLPWSALARHFAFGRVYIVRPPWTLVDTALILSQDSAEQLKIGMEAGQFGLPTADEAAQWHELDAQFDVLIVSPFVLVRVRA